MQTNPRDFSGLNYGTRELLSYDEEQLLIQRWRMHKDRAAYTKLFRCNTGLVISIAKGYRGRGLPMTDLIQYGFIGVHYGLQRYRLDEGNRLAGCLGHSIHAEIKAAVVKEFPYRPYKIPTDIADTMNQAQTIAVEHYREHGWHLSQKQLVDKLSDTPSVLPHYTKYLATRKARIRFALERKRQLAQGIVSYDGPLGKDDTRQQSNNITVKAITLEDTVVKKLFEISMLQRAFRYINPFQKKVLRLRYGMETGQPMTHQEVAAQFGCKNHQGYHATEARAMKKLRGYFLETLPTSEREMILQHLRDGSNG